MSGTHSNGHARLPILSRSFSSAPRRASGPYTLLPFEFMAIDETRHLLTNMVGEYIVLPKHETKRLIRGELSASTDTYNALLSRHFIMEPESNVALDLLATKYRTKNAFLKHGPSLFIFVVTLRCEHSCAYCQVSRRTTDKGAFDMALENADRAVDIVFESPSQLLKIEFQGGESLLNFPLIQHIVARAEARNEVEMRDLQFVIATNLALVTQEQLDFCKDHRIHISTSLDGPAALHNANRPRRGRDSHERAVAGIESARKTLGFDSVSALMTTTPASLEQPEAIIDEYARLGFGSVFLRPISPYGFAVRSGLAKSMLEAWLTFYRRALAHIFRLNGQGVRMREEFTAILARKILTPYTTGYVDLQSPTGLGLSCLVFNYDGSIHLSDESRMLAEMRDETFRAGHVTTHTLRDIMTDEHLVGLVRDTLLEGAPLCSECAIRPYCGTDPVYHHATSGDVLGFKPHSDFCGRVTAVVLNVIELLEANAAEAAVIRSWAS